MRVRNICEHSTLPLTRDSGVTTQHKNKLLNSAEKCIIHQINTKKNVKQKQRQDIKDGRL